MQLKHAVCRRFVDSEYCTVRIVGLVKRELVSYRLTRVGWILYTLGQRPTTCIVDDALLLVLFAQVCVTKVDKHVSVRWHMERTSVCKHQVDTKDQQKEADVECEVWGHKVSSMFFYIQILIQCRESFRDDRLSLTTHNRGLL